MWLYPHFQKQIPRRAAAAAGQPLAAEPHAAAVGKPLRDRHADRLRLAVAVEPHVGLAAVDREFERDLDPRREILARRLGGTSPAAGLRAAATKEIAEAGAAGTAEETLEVDLAPPRKAAPGKRATATAWAATGTTRADTLERTPVAVVHLPLALVVQHVECRLHLFELLLGRRIVGMEIGVILAGQLAVGLADVLGRSRAGHAKRLVIVLRHEFGSGFHWVRPRDSAAVRKGILEQIPGRYSGRWLSA